MYTHYFAYSIEYYANITSGTYTGATALFQMHSGLGIFADILPLVFYKFEDAQQQYKYVLHVNLWFRNLKINVLSMVSKNTATLRGS